MFVNAINTLIFRRCAAGFVLAISLLLVTSVSARQLDDVILPDSVTLDGSTAVLQLNGMGYRTKFIFKIYVAALYTEEKVASRDAVQALKGPKRIAMHIVYDEVTQKKMRRAWNDGFEDNTSEQKLKTLRSRLDTFTSYFSDLKAGDVVLLDYIPASGTRVSINGEQKALIEGADFYAALLDVWLGEEPADDELKEALLGVAEAE